MDKTIDRWTDPDGNGYAFKDTVARAQNRETIDKMNAETADRKSELDIERKRIDNLIKELPATAGEYQQSKLVLHSYGNTAVKCTTTSGNYTNVPAFTTDQGGPLSSLYTKKSNYQIVVNKSGLYLFELRINVNSLVAYKRVELAPFINDTRNAALASTYNTAGDFTLFKVVALPLWLSANDTVEFRIAPIDAVAVSLALGDVLIYAIDWEDKSKIPDYTGYTAETKDIRTGADGVVYGTAGEAVRKQIGNLTEDLVKLKEEVFYSTDTIKTKYEDVGFCISIDGKKQVKDGYIIGKYPVVENEVLFVSLSKDNSNGAVYQFMNNTTISYENNDYRVGNTVTEAYNGFITVPEGATYLFVSSLQSNTTNVVKKTKSEIDTLKGEVSNSAKDVYDIQSFLYPYISELNHNGGYLKYDDGEIAPTSYGKYTDYISLKSYTNVKYTCGIGDSSVAFVCFYDADYGYLKNISVQASSVKSGDVDITKEEYSNARYVRFSYYDYRDIADYSLFVGLLYNKESLDEKLKTIAPTYKIHNKNVLIFGDSITDCCPQTNNSDYQTTSYYFREPSNYYTNAEGQTVNYDMWAKLFKDICEPKEVRNYAKSGATYKNQDGTRLSLSNQIRIALNDLNNPNGVFSQNTFVPDVVIFALGTNDGANPNDTYESAMNKTVLKADGYTVDVEATLSNLDLSKFNEAVRYAFLTIKNRFPMAQVFVSLPIQRNSWEMHESNLVKSLEKMAKRYGCIVIDATAESGIISDINIYNNLGILLKDGLHPNEYGSNLLARMFITSVESQYMPMDAMNN